MTPTPTDTPPEAAAPDLERLRPEEQAAVERFKFRWTGGPHPIRVTAFVEGFRAARQHAELQVHNTTFFGGNPVSYSPDGKTAFFIMDGWTCYAPGHEPQGSCVAWTQEARDAVAALEERYEISVVSLEHHREWVERCERLEAQGSRAGGAPDAELREACKLWEHCTGDPPDWDSPLHNVFVAGMLYTEKLLAKLLDVKSYEPGDGSEDFDQDATTSLRNILTVARLYDPEDGAWAKLLNQTQDDGGVSQSADYVNPEAFEAVRNVVRTARDACEDAEEIEGGRCLTDLQPLNAALDALEELIPDSEQPALAGHAVTLFWPRTDRPDQEAGRAGEVERLRAALENIVKHDPVALTGPGRTVAEAMRSTARAALERS